jgi:hypothetical protein
MKLDLTPRRIALRAKAQDQRRQLSATADEVEASLHAALAPARLIRMALAGAALTALAWTLRRRRGWRAATGLWLVGRLGRALWRLPPR